jgi:hypothetical protein
LVEVCEGLVGFKLLVSVLEAIVVEEFEGEIFKGGGNGAEGEGREVVVVVVVFMWGVGGRVGGGGTGGSGNFSDTTIDGRLCFDTFVVPKIEED